MTIFNIPTSVQTKLRASAETTLSDSCVVYAVTRTADGYGDATVTETSRGTFVCRVAVASVNEQHSNVTTVTYTHKVFLPVGTTVATTDIIVCGGRRFSVVGTFAAKTAAVLLTVQCVEVT